jgi:hypothetical protein
MQILLPCLPQLRLGEVAKGYSNFQVSGRLFQVDECGFSHRIQFIRIKSGEEAFVLVNVSVFVLLATSRAVSLSEFHKLIL